MQRAKRTEGEEEDCTEGVEEEWTRSGECSTLRELKKSGGAESAAR